MSVRVHVTGGGAAKLRYQGIYYFGEVATYTTNLVETNAALR